MENRGRDRQRPPMAYSFVAQSGRKVGQSTQGTIRSHAMREVRNRQRRERRERSVRRGSPSAGYKICRCLMVVQSSSAEPGPSSENPGSDKSTNYPASKQHCHRCGGRQLSTLPQPKQMDILQQFSPTVASFAAADFDPFNAVAELPESLTSRFPDEIRAVTAHGTCTFGR
jgi:hypothetical protein